MLVCIIQLLTYSTIMVFITTQKGGQCLLWHGCCFIVNRKMDNATIYWRCYKHTCSAKITTQGEDETNSCVEQIGSDLRKKESSRRDCHQSIMMCCLSLGCNMTIQWQLLNSRSHRSRIPPLPKSSDEITLVGDWVITL